MRSFFFSGSVGEFDDTVCRFMANMQKSCAPQPPDHRQQTPAIWKVVRDRTSCYVVSCKWLCGSWTLSSSPALSFSGLPRRSPVWLRDFRARVFSNCAQSCILWCDQQVSVPLTMMDVVCSLQRFQHPTPLALREDFLGSSPATSAAASPFFTVSGLKTHVPCPRVNLVFFLNTVQSSRTCSTQYFGRISFPTVPSQRDHPNVLIKRAPVHEYSSDWCPSLRFSKPPGCCTH